jgi:glycosyltransferase involved in cell wall biosynthesis
MSWQFSAIPTGLRLIRKWHPHAIWSTYPIATAHIIGEALHRRTGLPWIADFRDPMAQEGYPLDPKTWRSFRKIEEQAIRGARFSTMTTPGAARLYRDRYPEVADRVVILENGFDEATFAGLGTFDARAAPLAPGAITLVHSGVVYPSERDPTQLFIALQELARDGRVQPGKLKLRFRGAMHETVLKELVGRYGVENFVELLPPLPYREALREMMRADGLLVLQAANCNEQIPAKIYEYLRCRRPILGLTDPRGDIRQVFCALLASIP